MNFNNIWSRFATPRQLREMTDDQYIELKAILPDELILPPPKDEMEEGHHEAKRERYGWLKSLLKFNDLLRERKAAQTALEREPASNEQPRTKEEAEQLGYVMASDVLAAFAMRFVDQASLTRFLERNLHIKTYKPTPNRKMVHAGDLIRHLANSADTNFDALNREGVETLVEEEKQKRIEERK